MEPCKNKKATFPQVCRKQKQKPINILVKGAYELKGRTCIRNNCDLTLKLRSDFRSDINNGIIGRVGYLWPVSPLNAPEALGEALTPPSQQTAIDS